VGLGLRLGRRCDATCGAAAGRSVPAAKRTPSESRAWKSNLSSARPSARRRALPAPRAPALGVPLVVIGALVVFLPRFVGCVGRVSAAPRGLVQAPAG
jgi:hypothetical protein